MSVSLWVSVYICRLIALRHINSVRTISLPLLVVCIVSISIYICMPICVTVGPSVRRSVSLSVHPSVCGCMYVCVPVYLSVCLALCQPVYIRSYLPLEFSLPVCHLRGLSINAYVSSTIFSWP